MVGASRAPRCPPKSPMAHDLPQGADAFAQSMTLPPPTQRSSQPVPAYTHAQQHFSCADWGDSRNRWIETHCDAHKHFAPAGSKTARRNDQCLCTHCVHSVRQMQSANAQHDFGRYIPQFVPRNASRLAACDNAECLRVDNSERFRLY